MHTSPWADWGRCTGGTRPKVERDLPPQCSPRAGREEVLRWARTSTGHYPGKSSCAPPAGAGLRLGPTTAHGEGGGPTNIAVLTRAPIYILGAPHSFVEGSLFLPQHRKTPSYPSCPVSSEPPPRLAWCGPVSLVTRRAGRGLLRAQVVCLAAFAHVFWSGVVAGTMLGWSRITLLLLTVAVTCTLAQQAPPVSEL